MDNAPHIQDPEFWARRSCLREPVPEIIRAAELLDSAVDAHLADEHGRAGRLIAEANMPEVRDWVESLCGSTSVQIHRFRKVEGAPPTLDENDRDPIRDAKKDPGLQKAIINRDGYRCRFCGNPVIHDKIRNAMRRNYCDALPWGRTNTGQHAAFQCLWLQFDHVLLHSRGGPTDLDNLIITCGACNFGRSDWTLEEVGLMDPRARPITRTDWDGLERFVGH